ncbi:hypothetical protein P7D22_12805, partial [Lichenihabitans sp. Uapishka_5]|nr:hypothetical protein [Lichenihabitans sp. Uapishka_5]
ARESGPTESPAPAPLALAGATAPPPAAAAANALVRRTKSLSLAVASGHRRVRPAKAAKLPPTKTLSILKEDEKPAGKAKAAAKHPAGKHPAKAAAK